MLTIFQVTAARTSAPDEPYIAIHRTSVYETSISVLRELGCDLSLGEMSLIQVARLCLVFWLVKYPNFGCDLGFFLMFDLVCEKEIAHIWLDGYF